MPEPEERTVRPFADFLTEQRGGVLHAELTDALNELVAAVNEHHKGGELVLRIKVKPATKSSYGAVAVADDVTIKKPAGERAEALFFVDRDSNLTRENPQQPRLPLRDVSAPADAADDSQAVEA